MKFTVKVGIISLAMIFEKLIIEFRQFQMYFGNSLLFDYDNFFDRKK